MRKRLTFFFVILMAAVAFADVATIPSRLSLYEVADWAAKGGTIGSGTGALPTPTASGQVYVDYSVATAPIMYISPDGATFTALSSGAGGGAGGGVATQAFYDHTVSNATHGATIIASAAYVDAVATTVKDLIPNNASFSVAELYDVGSATGKTGFALTAIATTGGFIYEWVDQTSIAGNLLYYGTADPADEPGYYYIASNNPDIATSVTTPTFAAFQQLGQWITEPGEPGLPYFQAGVYHGRLWSQRTAGTKETTLVFEIWAFDSAASLTFVASSNPIIWNDDIKQELQMTVNLNEAFVTATSTRMVLKLYGSSLGNVQVTFYFGGTDVSFIGVPYASNDLVTGDEFDEHVFNQVDPHGATMTVTSSITIGTTTAGIDASIERVATGIVQIASYMSIIETTATPTNPATFTFWGDGNTSKVRVWDGTTWNDLW